MKNGIYEVVKHKLVRDDQFIEISLYNVKTGKENAITLPYTEKVKNEVKENQYLTYFKPRGGVAYEFCKTVDAAELSLSTMLSYYAAGVSF